MRSSSSGSTWCRRGSPATHGAYLDYPFAAMLAVLRIESHRARSLVIAEDLGTSPEGFSDAIMDSNVLSYRILNFERDGSSFKPTAAYPRKALAAVATHDTGRPSPDGGRASTPACARRSATTPPRGPPPNAPNALPISPNSREPWPARGWP